MLRPAAGEVRMLLQRIKVDNMVRNCPPSFFQSGKAGEGFPGGNRFLEIAFGSVGVDPRKLTLLPATAATEEVDIELMGSLTSMSKVIPAVKNDDDVEFPPNGSSREDLLRFCSANLEGLPEPIERQWKGGCQDSLARGPNNIRVLQWNILSQSLGTKNDNFVRCPQRALDWKTRRFRILEEIARHDPDIVCLQEVDSFDFLRRGMESVNYNGHFFPKPDSPCLYLPENSGPDGCAIFFKKDKFELLDAESRIIEVWRVQSNQVVLSTFLRHKILNRELLVATTHLKARKGALLSSLRNEQGRDLLQYLHRRADGRPVICSGDFNAEPSEPVYQTITSDENLCLVSSYREADVNDQEPKYTSWKFRDDGEHKQTLDYVFHSAEDFGTTAVLDFPSGDQIGEDRLPSLAYASDHLSLVCDLDLFPDGPGDQASSGS